MMKYMTKFEKNIPVSTSLREWSSSFFVAPFLSSMLNRPRSFSSSTSWAACQKNRYGEMVVPNKPTRVEMYAVVHSRWGTNVLRATSIQSGFDRNAAITYANSTSVSHLNTRAISRYDDQKSNTVIRTAKTGVQYSASIPVIISVT